MGKSDETHRCDVQKIAEEKYIGFADFIPMK